MFPVEGVGFGGLTDRNFKRYAATVPLGAHPQAQPGVRPAHGFCRVAHQAVRSLANERPVADTQGMETLPRSDRRAQHDPAALSVTPVPPADYDSPWKDALEQYFPDFLAFFFQWSAKKLEFGILTYESVR